MYSYQDIYNVLLQLFRRNSEAAASWSHKPMARKLWQSISSMQLSNSMWGFWHRTIQVAYKRSIQFAEQLLVTGLVNGITAKPTKLQEASKYVFKDYQGAQWKKKIKSKETDHKVGLFLNQTVERSSNTTVSSAGVKNERGRWHSKDAEEAKHSLMWRWCTICSTSTQAIPQQNTVSWPYTRNWRLQHQ